MERKGQKLINHLTRRIPVLDNYEAQLRDASLVRVIFYMSDEELDKIINS